MPKSLSQEQTETACQLLRERAGPFADKVAPVYALLGWEWERAGKRYVPNTARIRQALLGLITTLEESRLSDELVCFSGGLQAGISLEEEDGTVSYWLKMEIEDGGWL